MHLLPGWIANLFSIAPSSTNIESNVVSHITTNYFSDGQPYYSVFGKRFYVHSRSGRGLLLKELRNQRPELQM